MFSPGVSREMDFRRVWVIALAPEEVFNDLHMA